MRTFVFCDCREDRTTCDGKSSWMRRAQTRQSAFQVQSRPNIVEDSLLQDPGPAVAAVSHPPPQISVHSPLNSQHSAADAFLGQPLDPAEEAVPCHHPPIKLKKFYITNPK
jgi:hypothetical protein